MEKTGERQDRFRPERELEGAIASIGLMADKLAGASFETLEKARDSGSEYAQMARQEILNVNGYNRVVLRVSGAGVAIPNFTETTREAENFGELVMKVDGQLDGLKDRFDFRDGVVDNIISISSSDESDEGFRSTLFFVLKEASPQSYTLTRHQDLPVATVRTQRYFYGRAGKFIDVAVPTLDNLRNRKESYQSLAVKKRYNPKLLKDIRSLGEALAHSGMGYTALNKISLLHDIALQGATFTVLGDDYHDDVKSALVHTIEQGRRVVVSGDEVEFDLDSGQYIKKAFASGVHGKVLDVILPSQYDNDMAATLAIESKDDEQRPIRLFPLADIRDFKF